MVRQRPGRAQSLLTVVRATRRGHIIAARLPQPEDSHGFVEPFRPLRPASGPKLIAAIVLGPMLWVVALIVASWLLDRTNAIELGLLVTAASFVVAAVVLSLLRVGRRREERRYADRA
jgi:hypothetical protein